MQMFSDEFYECAAFWLHYILWNYWKKGQELYILTCIQVNYWILREIIYIYEELFCLNKYIKKQEQLKQNMLNTPIRLEKTLR